LIQWSSNRWLPEIPWSHIHVGSRTLSMTRFASICSYVWSDIERRIYLIATFSIYSSVETLLSYNLQTLSICVYYLVVYVSKYRSNISKTNIIALALRKSYIFTVRKNENMLYLSMCLIKVQYLHWSFRTFIFNFVPCTSAFFLS